MVIELLSEYVIQSSNKSVFKFVPQQHFRQSSLITQPITMENKSFKWSTAWTARSKWSTWTCRLCQNQRSLGRGGGRQSSFKTKE